MIRFAPETCKPQAQQAYRFITNVGWTPAESPSATDFPATELMLITWNMDAAGEEPTERFLRALLHIRKKVLDGSIPPPPCCILLQEVHEDVFPTLLRHRWLREHFLVTPITSEGWMVSHGVVTLVTKSVPVSTVFSIELPKTAVGRQALFTDIHLSGPPPESNEEEYQPRVRTLRIANTHLEPEPSGARARPKQLEAIARVLNVPNTDAQICSGSMCSVHDSDKIAPCEAGFADAYKGIAKDGVTWGLQPRGEIPPCRLDKVLYFPTEQVEIQTPKRIGMHIMLKGGGYVSDHCGLSCTIKVLRDH